MRRKYSRRFQRLHCRLELDHHHTHIQVSVSAHYLACVLVVFGVPATILSRSNDGRFTIDSSPVVADNPSVQRELFSVIQA